MIREAAKKCSLLNGLYIKASPAPPPSSLMLVVGLLNPPPLMAGTAIEKKTCLFAASLCAGNIQLYTFNQVVKCVLVQHLCALFFFKLHLFFFILSSYFEEHCSIFFVNNAWTIIDMISV